MSLPLAHPYGTPTRFPRVSGDEPNRDLIHKPLKGFSPRERG